MAALTEDGHDVVDHGPHDYDPEDDYPVYCIPAAEAAVAEPGSLGVVVGGSGNGEQIAANKVIGVRAALAYDLDTAKLGAAAQRRQRDLASAPGCTPRRRRWSSSGCSWPRRSAASRGTPGGSRLLAEYERRRG